jgi:hypothetical protein
VNVRVSLALLARWTGPTQTSDWQRASFASHRSVQRSTRSRIHPDEQIAGFGGWCLSWDSGKDPQVSSPSVLVSVSVHPGTTSLPICQPSLYPHDSEYRNARERVGVDLESM